MTSREDLSSCKQMRCCLLFHKKSSVREHTIAVVIKFQKIRQLTKSDFLLSILQIVQRNIIIIIIIISTQLLSHYNNDNNVIIEMFNVYFILFYFIILLGFKLKKSRRIFILIFVICFFVFYGLRIFFLFNCFLFF